MKRRQGFYTTNLRCLFSGTTTKLYYVEEGVVNKYALTFVVKIPPHISDIQFSWQTLVPTPVRAIYKWHEYVPLADSVLSGR